ncbi:hypothetical protein ACD661_14925 [Legionella lytica]|uniref:Uncharacterized protein n=1 Tax=Legionella lytica TaxID=96232 RepID=A0ABW8DAX3_9GAMM
MLEHTEGLRKQQNLLQQALEIELPQQKQNVNKAIVAVEPPEEIPAQANDVEADDELLLSLIDQTLDAGEQHLLKGSEIRVELLQEDHSATHEVEPKDQKNDSNQPKIGDDYPVRFFEWVK